MLRRTFLYTLAGLGLAACDQSCDKDTGTAGPSKPAARRAGSPIGTSNVATLTDHDVSVVAAAGLTLVQAELIPFNEGADDVNIDHHLPRIKDAVAAARDLDVIFFLTMVNWNGPAQRQQNDTWFRNALDRVIKEIGPSGVWLEGVSEPDSSAKAQGWISWTLSHWPGIKVVNGQGGHGGAGGGDILDYHYCSYSSLIQGVKVYDRLHSTDCGPVLASRLSESQVREVTRAALDAGRKLIVYDTSNAPGLNVNVVRWMGETVQEVK